jgi:hypothetical protein
VRVYFVEVFTMQNKTTTTTTTKDKIEVGFDMISF